MAGFYSDALAIRTTLHWPGLSPPCTIFDLVRNIDAGYILIVAEKAYVVARRLPDAFHTRSLDADGDTVVFGFAELAAVHAEGMLRDERPAMRPGWGMSAVDGLWRVIVVSFLDLTH